jgi:ABC-type nitrate/sulfonate/bicarbonate transport system substrate-binding protein
MRPGHRTLAPLLLLLLAAVSMVGCGGDSGSGATAGTGGSGSQHATLVLDFVPGPVHAGIYEALAKGYYEDEGIDLEIVEPTSTADTLKLIDAGKADFGIADGIDLATQIAAGRGAQGILAIAQRPLGGLITLTASGIGSPAGLEGQTVGVTGVPSDEAILDTIVAADGGDPAKVDTVTIGFNGVSNLENGNVDAITGFIPADAVQAEIDGYPTTSFAPDRYGDLVYPGLVAFSTEDRIAAEPELMQGFVSATVRGYEDVIADPKSGLTALLAANPAIPARFARASLRAYLPSFTAGAARFGTFADDDVRRLSAFMVDNGLADEPIDPARYATNEFVEGG